MPATARTLLRNALTAAGYTVESRDLHPPHAAVSIDFGYLPGQILISDAHGCILYPPEDHSGFWARYCPASQGSTVQTAVYNSRLTDIAADTEGLLAALAALQHPASAQLAAQVIDRQQRLTYIRRQQARWTNPEVLAGFDATATQLRAALERITLAVIADSARPVNR